MYIKQDKIITELNTEFCFTLINTSDDKQYLDYKSEFCKIEIPKLIDLKSKLRIIGSCEKPDTISIFSDNYKTRIEIIFKEKDITESTPEPIPLIIEELINLENSGGTSYLKEYSNKFGLDKTKLIFYKMKELNETIGKGNWYMINWNNLSKIDFVKIIDNRHGEVIYTIKWWNEK